MKPLLDIVLDGRTIGRCRAENPREDVREPGFGDGRCEFRFDLPPELSAEDATRIRVRFTEADLYLGMPVAPPGAAREAGRQASYVNRFGEPGSGWVRSGLVTAEPPCARSAWWIRTSQTFDDETAIAHEAKDSLGERIGDQAEPVPLGQAADPVRAIDPEDFCSASSSPFFYRQQKLREVDSPPCKFTSQHSEIGATPTVA